jgi:RNA-binding protein YhbY
LTSALNHYEVVKVKFDEFTEQKKELAPQLAEKMVLPGSSCLES